MSTRLVAEERPSRLDLRYLVKSADLRRFSLSELDHIAPGRASVADAFEPRTRELLAAFPRMPTN
jgi:hypothetical protein